MNNSYCKNHPDRKAINSCHNCKESLCEECLEEGLVYYYCRKPECYTFIEREINELIRFEFTLTLKYNNVNLHVL